MRHALIIGAGPAGSVAAIRLARAGGWRVTLVEQHRFPRDKVCGECLSALGIDVIHRLNLRARLDAARPIVLCRTIIHAPNGASAELRLPRPMCGISRLALDQVLLDAARDAGATIVQPARCEKIETMIARVRSLVTNRVEAIRADFILVADGKAALGSSKPPATSDLGIKAHFTNVQGPRDAIELFGIDRHYGGLAPIEGDRWNAAFSVPIDHVNAHRGNLDEMFERIVSENASLRARLRGARRSGPWLSSALPRFGVTRSLPEGVIPLGNAAAAIEPIGGEGMGLAMRSAEIVTDAILRQRVDPRAIRREYEQLWKLRGRACRAAALAVSSPRGSAWFVGAARIAPLASIGLRAIGKR